MGTSSYSGQLTAMMNPLAPPVYGGMVPVNGELDFTYPYDKVLTASQTLSDAIVTATDADFEWRAIVINAYTSVQFQLRFSINNLYYLSSSYMLAANLASDPSTPWPIMGQLIVPMGARIGIDLVELSGVQNTVEILCRGVKRYNTRS